MVSGGSRPSGVTTRAPTTRPAPPHAGSPPRPGTNNTVLWPRGGRGGKGVGVVTGGAGAHRGGEPGVPGAWGHAQDPPDTLRTPTRRLTSAPGLSTLPPSPPQYRGCQQSAARPASCRRSVCSKFVDRRAPVCGALSRVLSLSRAPSLHLFRGGGER